jgi:hypothetical protein
MSLFDEFPIVTIPHKPTIGSADFFKSLGQYVYAYIDDNGQWLYSGKGNGNRGLSHIKTKGYDIDKLYIVARNLERFENKDDWQSFLLESFIISKYEPIDNLVSGHYKECFVMAKFSELFNEYQNDQHDNFESFPEWYTTNYDKLKNRMGQFTIKSGNVYIESVTRRSMAMSFYCEAVTNTVSQVKFSIWGGSKENNLEVYSKQLLTFLESEGYTDSIEQVGDRKNHLIYQVAESDIQSVINLFDNFMG